jgi:hypothetical protein|tara:strand:+ start:864 stop:1094 length:231 start_codon:yes stop_codon:yes gene_type:complete
MVIKEDESIEIEDCECGSKKYGYCANNGIIFICFKCGRFYSDDLPDTIIRAFTEDPSILLALIKSDHFKRIDMPDE